ncbi:N-6 DNA methylase [Streptomyces sp. 372A]
MAKLTLAQLGRHLFAAADILRGTIDAAECRDLISVLLFLKRVNDEFEAARDQIEAEAWAAGSSPEEVREEAETYQNYRLRGVLFVPDEARWGRLAGAVNDVATRYLQPALDKLESQEGNSELWGLFRHVDFNRIGGGAGWGSSAMRLADERLSALVKHFGSIRLRDEDFEFPDMIGVAYENLIKDFADSAGNKGGEFYTPRAVVRMMVELARPTAGMRIYDPCAGSGGMLIHAKEYIDEHGGDSSGLLLAGQDANSGSWAMATMNMVLHGVEHFSLMMGDTLTNPLHRGGDFDLVLSNPPFSMDYERERVPHLKERMPYGEAPERGKADLMFLQHMLHRVQGRGGSVFTVMPHGVLFRGGGEQKIRTKLLDAQMIEAVIGLAPNLFYGTGIPACVIVLRAPGQRPEEQRDKVLFINADREYHAVRAQNVLLPEHVEKIVSTFHAYADVEGFARVVDRNELARNADNLSIRRYVDNTPPPEPQDVRAHLMGGVPVVEIEAKKPLLDAYGIASPYFFSRRQGDPDYLDFLPLSDRPDVIRLTELSEARESAFREAFKEWWHSVSGRVAALAPVEREDRTEEERKAQLAGLRADLTDSFGTRLLEVGLLDQHALAGAVAGWWHDTKHDLAALSTHGFGGVIDGWIDTVAAMLAPEPTPSTGGSRKRSAAERRQAYAHKVVGAIAPGFVEELAAADRTKSVLDARVKSAEVAKEYASGADASSGPASAATKANEGGASEFRRERVAAARRVRELEREFWPFVSTAAGLGNADSEQSRLMRDREALDEVGERDAVLGCMHDALARRIESHVTRRRRELIAAYEKWEVKYGLSFREIESRLTGSADGFVKNNPWSRRSPWSFDEEGSGAGSVRQLATRRIYEIIDAEKAVEAALAKLDVDVYMALIPLLAPHEADEQGWTVHTLRDVVLSARNGMNGRSSKGVGGISVVQVRDLGAAGVDVSRLRSPGLLAPSDFVLQHGDVLFTSGPLPQGAPYRAAVWLDSFPKSTISTGVSCLTPDPVRLDSGYLAEWLRHPIVQARVRGQASSVRGADLVTASRMLDVEIELPSLAQQRGLTAEISQLADQRVQRSAQLAKLRLIKQAMMNDLGTGQASISYL